MDTKLIAKFLRDDSGATAIEYGLIAALVSVAAITALTAMGGSLDAMFTAVSTALNGAVTASAGGGLSAGGKAARACGRPFSPSVKTAVFPVPSRAPRSSPSPTPSRTSVRI